MTDFEKERASNKEYNDLDRYRTMLIGRSVKTVDFTTDSDEGLVLVFDNGYVLYFGFNGYEGTIAVGEN